MASEHDALQGLIDAFARLPGIGRKTAERLSYHILQSQNDEAEMLAQALHQAKHRVRPCKRCFLLTAHDECNVCRNPRRNQKILCVVEDTRDAKAIEKTGAYQGLYHVLGGVLSPMDGIGPEDLHLKELLQRLRVEPIDEVILALNPSVEGEATSLYLQRLIAPSGIRLSRLAQGLPMGGDLKYIDALTLMRAFAGRQNYGEDSHDA